MAELLTQVISSHCLETTNTVSLNRHVSTDAKKELPVKRLFKIIDFVMRYSQTDKDYIERSNSLKFSN